MYGLCRPLRLHLTFCGFAKKRIAKRNLSIKNAVCALKIVHFNTQCRFFAKELLWVAVILSRF
jgi:hypothetical protein